MKTCEAVWTSLRSGKSENRKLVAFEIFNLSLLKQLCEALTTFSVSRSGITSEYIFKCEQLIHLKCDFAVRFANFA